MRWIQHQNESKRSEYGKKLILSDCGQETVVSNFFEICLIMLFILYHTQKCL